MPRLPCPVVSFTAITHLVGELDQLRCRANRRARYDATVLLDISCFYDDHIQLVVWPILGIVALDISR